MKKILYIGENNPNATSAHRAFALQRLGYYVKFLNPYPLVPKDFFRSRFHYRTGYHFLQGKIKKIIINEINNINKPDLIWIDSGELLGVASLKSLKKLGCPVILYNHDDPTGKRDGSRFNSLIKAMPFYDLVVVVRTETAKECTKLGAKQILQVFMSYDEIAHKPFDSIEEIPEKFKSDVVFVGTWMPQEKRDEFLLKLIDKGIPLSIWGDPWQKSENYSKLKPFIRGKAIYGRDYVAAIQGAKICIGILSKGNRDLHTTRSLEIPFIGGLFCAERTTEHQNMYKEGVEAVFWNNADECANICISLLADDNKRENIRLAGMKRVREMKVGNEEICKKILNTLNFE